MRNHVSNKIRRYHFTDVLKYPQERHNLHFLHDLVKSSKKSPRQFAEKPVYKNILLYLKHSDKIDKSRLYLHFPRITIYCYKWSFAVVTFTLYGTSKRSSGERGGPGSKKQVWLISKSNLSWSYYFLRNRKIFVYEGNMARQS